MRKISYLIITLLSFTVFNSCEEADLDPDLNYITFAEPSYSTGIDIDGSETVDVTVYTSNITGSDRTFNVMVDPSTTGAAGSYQVPSSVTIPGGTNEGTLSVMLSDVDLGIGVNKLVLDFEVMAGQDYGNPVTINYSQNCNEISATLDIVFDIYPEESGWQIIDELGGVVLSKAAGIYDGQTSATETLTLCAGRNYTFVFTDSFGDGMNGSYTLTIGGDVKVSGGGGDFGSSESTDFDTN